MTPTRRQAGVLAVAALVLAAVNLRLAVTSVGPVLAEIRSGLGMSGTVAGLLTSLPVVCFASVGFAAPRLARRFGATAVVATGLILVTAGLAVRPFAPGIVAFILLSGVALAGIAVVNVLLPMIVKERFAANTGLFTGIYSLALNLGAAVAAGATVPLAGAFGDDWRYGLGFWALIAALAVPPWLVLARDRQAAAAEAAPDGPPLRIARTGVGWSVAVYFGMQSTSAYVIIGWLAQIYRDAGLSAQTAGVLFATTSFLGVPLGFLITSLAGRLRSQSWIAMALGVAGIAGYGGMWWDPAAAPWLWAILLGVVNCAFPLVLTMIALRGRTPASVVRLSAFGQGVGYIIAIPGPILIGAMHDASGGWRLPLGFMVALMIPQLIAGFQAGRDRQI